MSGPILVTGATGFLGRHVLSLMQATTPRPRVVALVRDPAAWRTAGLDTAFPEVAIVQGTLEDSARWADAPELRDCAGILHLAAIVKHSRHHAEAMLRTNVAGTVAMVRVAARYRCRLVYFSTSGTVGCSRDAASAPDEDAPLSGDVVARWPYYASKVASERESRAEADRLGVTLVTLRAPVLLGPGDTGGRSSSHVSRLLRSRLPITLHGGMHFTDVRDVAAAAVRALAIPDPRPVYHLPGCNTTLIGFGRMVFAAAEVRKRQLALPGPVAHALATLFAPLGIFPDPVLVEMATHHWNLASRYSERDLGYRSRDPELTLRDTVRALAGA